MLAYVLEFSLRRGGPGRRNLTPNGLSCYLVIQLKMEGGSSTIQYFHTCAHYSCDYYLINSFVYEILLTCGEFSG